MDNSSWITQQEVADILGISYGQVPRVAAKADIRKRIIPGSRPRFHRGDAEDVVAKSVQGAEVQRSRHRLLTGALLLPALCAIIGTSNTKARGLRPPGLR